MVNRVVETHWCALVSQVGLPRQSSPGMEAESLGGGLHGLSEFSFESCIFKHHFLLFLAKLMLFFPEHVQLKYQL